MDFFVEGLIDILAEVIFAPIRLVIHWIVRSLGGSNPRYYWLWIYACRFLLLLAGVLFLGAIVGIIVEFIGPFTMFWMFVGSFALYVFTTTASEEVDRGSNRQKLPPQPTPDQNSDA